MEWVAGLGCGAGSARRASGPRAAGTGLSPCPPGPDVPDVRDRPPLGGR